MAPKFLISTADPRRLGVLAGSVLLFLTGCQFGNRTTTSLTGYDTISGYYASLPQTLSFNAQVGSTPRTQAGLVNQMPDFLKSILANPTLLYYDSPTDGSGTIRSHGNTGLGFPTIIQDHEQTFGASTSAAAIVSGCKILEESVHHGSFSQTAPSTIAGLSVRGKLSVDYSISYSLIGDDVDCDAMRATFKSCFSDGVACSSDASSIFYEPFVEQLFAPLVNSGIITEAEISSVRSFGYRATYE